MPDARNVLTPDALAMLHLIGETGSFAAAARAANMVPSALTYRVRQIEDALDVLLFDRSSRQARPTEAGAELLREGTVLLAEVDAIANRIKRIATGWEPHFTVAVDSIIDRKTVMELCTTFLRMNPPTRLRLRGETLSGTLEALTSGRADLALGVVLDASTKAGLQSEALDKVQYVFAVAADHPLAQAPEPLGDEVIRQHRAVAIADTVMSGTTMSIGLLTGQDVFSVADMPTKVDAQVRGIGVGFLPTGLAQPHIDAGRLVVKQVARAAPQVRASYAWRKAGRTGQGRALQWWLEQLQAPVTRAALMGERPRGRKPV